MNAAPSARGPRARRHEASASFRDTGLAMVFLALLIGLWRHSWGWVQLGTALLVVALLWPTFFLPVARVWVPLSHRVSKYGSFLVLSLIFALLVTPVGVVRRLFGYDPMRLRSWKKGDASVFHDRHKQFTGADLAHPY